MHYSTGKENHERFTSPTGGIPSGSLQLDIALGCGGIPRGLLVEISGPETSGKTTLCQHITAEAQKSGGVCGWIDADGTLNPAYAQRCGVDIENLYVSTPSSAEQAVEISEKLARSGAMALVVMDSVSALVPEIELITPLGVTSSQPIDNLLSPSLRRITTAIRKSGTTVIFTNNIKRGIGVVYHNLSSNPSRLALKLFAGLRIALSPGPVIRDSKQIMGNIIQVRILKNESVPCFHTIKFDIMYNDGINKAGEIFDLANRYAVINRQGDKYTFQGLLLGGSRHEVVHHLKQNLPLSEAIEQVIRQKLIK